MSSVVRHERPGIADDFVHERAKALRISVEELFERAYADAGHQRTSALIPYRDYALKHGSGAIPDAVRAYCEKPLPTCANPACPNAGALARFTKTNVRGKTFYFCSLECMKETPEPSDELPDVADKSTAGMRILERVRAAISKAIYTEIEPALIRPLAGQPRVFFDDESMANLVRSLEEVGQVSPGLVRSIPRQKDGVQYEVLDGERRWRGVIMADIPHYRAMLVEIDDEAAPFVISVIANFNREGHTVLEEVDAVIKLHEGLGLTVMQIAHILGKHYVTISQLYGLRRLAPEVRDMLDERKTPKSKLLPKNAAIEISKSNLPPARQIEMALRMLNKEFTLSGLRRHIESSGYGTGRTRTEGPEKLRQKVADRVRRLKLLAGDLKVVLIQEATKSALTGLDAATLRQVSDDMHAARAILTECEQLVATPGVRTA